MEHHLAVSTDRMPPPPPRWAASLPYADQHPLETNASMFGGLSALREAAFGQDERPSLLPPVPSSSSSASYHQQQQQQQQQQPSYVSSLPPSPLYYSRDTSNASTASSASSSASLSSAPRAADPPFYFAPFPTLPTPGQTRVSHYDGDKRALSPESDSRHYSPPPYATRLSPDPIGADSFVAKPPAIPRRSPIGAPLAPERKKTSPPSITGPIGVAGASRRVSDEERKAKHREAQRRFVRRKKIAMQQLRELATTLEKQFDLLQAAGERQRLESENATLQDQLELEAKNGASKYGETDPAAGGGNPSERRESLKVAQHPGWEYREFAW